MQSPLFLANWKMNKLGPESAEFASRFVEILEPNSKGAADVGIAPALTSLAALSPLLAERDDIMLGVQNVHWLESGAHTGEVSLPMVQEFGVDFAILGHSERRQFYGETSESVAERAAATLKAGLVAVVCIGESLEQYQSGRALEVISEQLTASLAGISGAEVSRLVLAYEPVWAIGTGVAATVPDIEKAHAEINRLLELKYSPSFAAEIPILYGGSTKAENIEEIVAIKYVGGALVGGASLKPESFAALIQGGRKATA